MKINSLKNYSYLTLFLAFVYLTSGGCKKKDVETYPESQKTLITVNFTNNFINPKLGAIVFASDALGNVIADTTASGNCKIMLRLKPGITVPSLFMLTVVTWEPSMHNFVISMNSYMSVPTSSEWTLMGHRPDTLGHFTVNLTNVPPSSLIIYANTGYENLTTNYDNVNNLSYTDPDNLFIKLENNPEQKYQWISGVHPGGTYNVDMATAITPGFSQIGLSGKYYEARIWGYFTGDYENSLPVMTNYSLGNVPAGQQIKVAVLPERFQGYHTELKLVESWTDNTSYTCRVNGPIPASFLKIDASVQSLSTFPAGKIEVHPSGDFTSTVATWQFYGHNNQAFTWNLYGSDTSTVFKLPYLSPSMLQTFPTLSLDSLSFLNVELSEYPGLTSYNEFLHQVFDPAHPRSPNKLDASTLIFGQGK